MATAFAPIPGIPSALHRAEDDLPFVEYQEGVVFQLLHADGGRTLGNQSALSTWRHYPTSQTYGRGLRLHDQGFVELPGIP